LKIFNQQEHLAEAVADISKVEAPPRMSGRLMHMFLAPN
jgi:translation initiation factor IF-3